MKLVFEVQDDNGEVVVEKSQAIFEIGQAPRLDKDSIDAAGLIMSRFVAIKLGVMSRVQAEMMSEVQAMKDA